MLLTIDAGNTNVVIALFDGERQVFESRVDTDSKRMADQYATLFDDIFRLYKADKSKVNGAVISSVVPPITRELHSAVKRLFGVESLTVAPGVRNNLEIKIDHPDTLGSDLVCGSVAAKHLYRSPCIIIDMGTVTKVMALDKSGAFIGCVLSPGVGIGLEAMAGKTALLPLVEFGYAKNVIVATNTADCIRSGLIYGNACMLDGLIAKFEAEIGEKCSVVATGGYCEIIIPYCEKDIAVNKGLVSEGLRLIYEMNREKTGEITYEK